MTRRSPAQYDFDTLEFDEQILPVHFSALNSRGIRFVVAHHMTIPGTGNGSALDACYQTWLKRLASAHYGVDGGLIRQYVWDKDFAWATGSNYGNLHGISVEHANSTLAPTWQVSDLTIKTGAKLAAYLHKVYRLGRPTSNANGTTGTLRQHESFVATACPGPYLGGTQWNAYVAEVQRAYDLATKPPSVPSPVIEDTSLVFGYGNTGPTNYVLSASDKSRLVKQITLIRSMGVSLFVALELHEENGNRGALDFYEENLPSGWGVWEGKGGNMLVGDFRKYRLLRKANLECGIRWATKWNVERISTGLPFWVSAYHTPAGMTPARLAARAAGMKQFLAWTSLIGRGVWAIDKNNATSYPGSPTKQLSSAGITDMYDAVVVENAEFNSYHDRVDTGKHIDFLGVGSMARFTQGQQVRTGTLADHDWLRGHITIQGEAA